MHKSAPQVEVALNVGINQKCMLKVNAKEREKVALVTIPKQTSWSHLLAEGMLYSFSCCDFVILLYQQIL